jgi:cell division protein FtsN
MDDENVRMRDRVELSLDGRQIASIVVGALVLLGVVFVLGLNVGRSLAERRSEATRGDALAALDQPPVATPPSDALTFHDRLTRDRLPQAEPPAPAGAAAPEPSARPTPARAEPRAAAAPVAAPTSGAAATVAPGARASYSIQVLATPNKAEAERLVAKLKEYAPRVEEAEVPGKGRLYRVRVGAFGTKPEAERFLKGLASKTGSKGLVVASR